METIAARLGTWAASLTAEAVPLRALQQARRCVVDVVGVAMAGAVQRTARRIQAYVEREYARGPCSMFGSNLPVSASGAALANGTSAHVLDYDDTSYAGIVHASAVVWPAVQAAGQAVGISGREALTAFVAGSEVEYALGQGLGNIGYDKGWWNTSVLGTIGAAAGAARAFGLDGAATAHAIAIAAASTGGARSVLGTPAKPYLCGCAAQAGVAAAASARAGIAGPATAFEHKYGLASLFNDGVFREEALDLLGIRYALVAPGIALKRYPVCSAAQAAMQAMLELVVEHDLDGDDLEVVVCEVTPLVDVSLVYERPKTPTECQFSMPFAMACIALFRTLDPSMLDCTIYENSRVVETMRKVSMKRDDSLFSSAREREEFPEGAVVKLTLRDGRRLSRRVGASTGMSTRPMSATLLRDKFLDCATRAISPEQAALLHDRLASLDEQASMATLFAH